MDEERVLRLAPDWESRGGQLNPQEGFLLSRIDGATSWQSLRQIAGLPAEQVDETLERWVKEGLVLVEGRSPAGGSAATPEAKTCVPDAPEQAGEVDAALDIPVEVQEQILELEAKLGGSYHAILGVARDAKDREIKRAYFQLSKVVHPDRYFGRDTGSFSERLDRVFKKVALAYELLMDPTTRAELERSMAAAPPEPEAPPKPGAPPRKPTRHEMLARLRRQFRIPEEILAERRFKAKQFREAARVASHQQKWNDAASSIRLAIAFDPWTEEYKEEFADIQAEVNQLRAAQLLDEASGAYDARSRNQALRLYEEAMGYRPSDPEIHAKAAQVACELESFEQAFEYAERACELAPDVGAHQLVLSRALRGQGLMRKALAALEAARSLDPGNPEILEELKRIRQRPGRSSGGKP